MANELNPSGPKSRVTSGQSVPSTPSGELLFGSGSGTAYPLPLAAGGGAVNVVTAASGTNIPTVVKIEASSAGNNTIIAAPGNGFRLVIWHFNFLTRGAVNIRLLSGATELSGLYNFGDDMGMAFDASGTGGPIPCGNNEAFIINLSGAVAIDGFVLYSTLSV